MNRPSPNLSLILIVLFVFLTSCKEQIKTSAEEQKIQIATEPKDSDFPLVLTTKSGKGFELQDQLNSDGMTDYHIIPKGFEFSGDTLIISDADPFSDAFLADLDSNGFEEIYLVTTSTGSGSYGNIYAYASNADKSVSPIYIAPPTEKDLLPGGPFEGYMGHDSIYLDEGKLKRKFPIYLEGDPNCCPTGGQNVILYHLIAGEASWKLKPAKP